uniref:Uncharacterized protein n=1 Tax=Desulfatirhabdium butyrativorans TaxID=340467 RepID=A0A7C4VR54_9BACT
MPELRLQNLLWSTRGREWGFRFLHKPAVQVGIWESIYQSIFGSDECVPQRWHGTITHSYGPALQYVASRFIDPIKVWKDAAGREIPHEMLLILETGAEETAGFDWERVVFEFVRSYYQDQFEKDLSSIQPFVGEAVSFDLPLNVAQCSSIRRDICIDNRYAKPQTDEMKHRLPLYEVGWQVLNTDIKVLMKKWCPSGKRAKRQEPPLLQGDKIQGI